MKWLVMYVLCVKSCATIPPTAYRLQPESCKVRAWRYEEQLCNQAQPYQNLPDIMISDAALCCLSVSPLRVGWLRSGMIAQWDDPTPYP